MRPVAHDSPIPAKYMKINIKTQGGKTITMYVEEFDTINNVKDALDWNHGIAACRGKSLMQDCAGLANMWQLGINDGDTLHLVDPPPSGKQPRVTEAAATSHNAPVHRGPEIPGHPGLRRISLQRFERMHGLDVTDSPESDAMANAPAEAPVRTAPEIPGHPGLRRITHICGLAVPGSPDRDSMVEAPTEAPDENPKKDADRELED